MRFVRGLFAVVVGIVVMGSGLAPAHAQVQAHVGAQADGYAVTVSSASGVLFKDCTDHPLTYAVEPPVDATVWSLELFIQAPDGTSAGHVYLASSSPTTGVVTEQFCASDLPGTYSVTGVFDVLTHDYKSVVTDVSPFTFDMRMPYSKVKAKASDKTPKRGQRVRVRVKVKDERPSGAFFGTSGADVQLQRRRGSRWVGVAGTKDYTNSAGNVVLSFRHVWKGKTSFRVSSRDQALGNTRSRAFTLRTRR